MRLFRPRRGWKIGRLETDLMNATAVASLEYDGKEAGRLVGALNDMMRVRWAYGNPTVSDHFVRVAEADIELPLGAWRQLARAVARIEG